MKNNNNNIILQKTVDFCINHKIIVSIIGIVFITIVIPYIINRSLYINIVTHDSNDGDWLGFWGSFLGGIFGGLATLITILFTIKSIYMNSKPVIKPIKKYFYVYTREHQSGITITDKSLYKMVEYNYKNKEIDFNQLDISMIEEVFILLKSKSEIWKSEIQKILDEGMHNKIYKDIKDICNLRIVEDAFKQLKQELPKRYINNIDKDLINDFILDLIEIYRIDVCVNRIIYRELFKNFYFIPMYNVGTGHALDVEVKWDMDDKSYKVLCSKLGISEYDLKNRFSFENIYSIGIECLLNEQNSNKINVQIPTEIIDLIKYIVCKSIQNINDKKHIQNNILVNENKIAQLNINYFDIHGNPGNEKYNVIFKIWNNADKVYGYDEKKYYLKFIRI